MCETTAGCPPAPQSMHSVHMLDSAGAERVCASVSADSSRDASTSWQGGAMALPRPDERKAGTPVLREPVHLVSRRAVTYWTVRAAAGWLVLLVGQVAWFWQDDSHRGLRVLALAVTVLVGAAHLVVMPRWRYRVHRWEVSPLAVYTQSGWLDPGAPDRADLADPDRRLPARPVGAAVRARQRHRHHRLRSGTAAHQGARRRHGAAARARAHHRDRGRRGRRDVSLAPQLEWRRLSAPDAADPPRPRGRPVHPRHRRPAHRGTHHRASGPGGA